MITRKEIYIILVLLCILVYANSIKGAFITDDITSIVENPNISRPLRFWSDPQQVLNSLAYSISGLNPWAYHLISIILHSINTLLVFSFLRLFFQVEASFFVACLFAVHPVHAEAVTWISGRPYLFLTAGSLLIYFLYQHALVLITAGKKSGIFRYILATLIFTYLVIKGPLFFALLPALLMLSDTLFSNWRKRWKWWIPFLVIVIVRLIVVKVQIQYRMGSLALETQGQPVYNNPFLYFIYSVFSHLWLLFWPQRLTIYHEPVIFQPFLIKRWMLCLLPILLALVWAFRKDKRIFFSLSMFIILLAPTYSPVPIASVVAERYIYFPAAIFSMALAYLYEKYIPKDRKAKRYAVMALTIILSLYAVRTIARNEDYHSQQRFSRMTLEASPNSPRAHNSLGLVYLNEANLKRAIGEFQEAIRINPLSFEAYSNLSLAYCKTGELDPALFFAGKAMELKQDAPAPFYNLAELYNRLGNKDQAITYLKKVIQLAPDHSKSYNCLGNIYSDLGYVLGATAAYRKSIELDARNFMAHYNLGNLYNSIGDKEEAISLYNRALRIDPNSVDVYNNLGSVYSARNEYELAVKAFQKAIKLDHMYVRAYSNLGNLYTKFGNSKAAIQILTEAMLVDDKHAPACYNLAAAYFYEKDYALAIKYCDQALSLGYSIPEGFLKELEPHRKNK